MTKDESDQLKQPVESSTPAAPYSSRRKLLKLYRLTVGDSLKRPFFGG